MKHQIKKPLLSLTKQDFKIITFCTGGKGGQNQNRRKMGVRITHKTTSISYECREERSQLQNKKKAFLKLCNDEKIIDTEEIIDTDEIIGLYEQFKN